jgi:hypothetical protein
VRLSPGVQHEIKQIEAHIDNIEAASLVELNLQIGINATGMSVLEETEGLLR